MSYKSITKIICLFIIIFSWIGILSINQTTAYFNDIETSSDNTFQAGTLDFHLLQYNENENNNENEVEKNIQIINKGSLSFQYNIRVRQSSGYSNLCQALQLEAYLEKNEYEYYEYNGNLLNFVSSHKIFDFSDNHIWNFEIYLSENYNFQGEVCNFEVIFTGWQSSMNYQEGGFVDVEKFNIQFIAEENDINNDEEENDNNEED